MGYEDLDVVDPTAGEAKSGQEATISEVRWRRRVAAAGGGQNRGPAPSHSCLRHLMNLWLYT